MKKFYCFMISMMTIVSCYSNQIDSLLPHKEELSEASHYFPASIEAIDFSCRLCIKRVVTELQESIKGKTDDEKLEIIKIYEEMCQKGLYFIWSLGNGLFEKLQNEYNDTPLVFFDGYKSLDKDGLFIRYIKGMGIQKNNKIKILTIFDDSLISPSISTIEDNNASQVIVKNDSKILKDWKKYIEGIEQKKDTIEIEFFENNEKIQELEQSNTHIWATASFPFIKFLNICFQSHLLVYFSALKNEFSDNNAINKICEDFEKTLKTSPLGKSILQWDAIVNESKKTNQLYFYQKTIKYKIYLLHNEYGFVVQQNNRILNKIPLNVEMFIYNHHE